MHEPDPPPIVLDLDIADLVPTFYENRVRDVERIRAHLAADTLDEVRRVGHAMKGSGTSYGFPSLTSLGDALEQAATRGDLAACTRLCDEVEAQLDGLRVQVGTRVVRLADLHEDDL